MVKHKGFTVLPQFLLFLIGFTISLAQAQIIRYVNRTDATCGGHAPCYATIQAAINAAGPGDNIRIQSGTYPEQLSITGKNNLPGASDFDRIVIEADPTTNPGQVVLSGKPGACTGNFAIRLQQSKFITVRGLTISGTGGQAISLLGGNNQNQDVHLELNRIFGNGSGTCDGGITINRGNPRTLIVNNLIYDNGRNAISFIDADGGPHYIINNTVWGNQWNGVDVARNHIVTLANNIINSNGTASGTTGGRFGVRRESSTIPQPAGIKLLNNLVCGNIQGQISGQILDATDSSNFTPLGNEGAGVSALPGCELPTNLFRNRNGLDDEPDTADDDFGLKPNSLAIDVGTDPRSLGFNPSYSPIFEADFMVEGIRPADGNADRAPAFDVGAFEFANAPPIANAGATQSVATSQLVTLNGTQSSDPEGASLTFQWMVVSEPAGSAITLNNSTNSTPSFTPQIAGQYSIRLVVTDGQFFSEPSTVVINVVGVNQAPIAISAIAATNEDIAVTVTLTASDVDSANLSFALLTNPANATLGSLSIPNCVASGSGSNCTATVIYTPNANYSGADSFTFKAHDAGLDSNIATISLTVGAVNDAPVVNSVSVSTDEDTPVVVTLIATDVDSASISFTIVAEPTKGTLGTLSARNCVASGAGSNCTATVTYSPNADYNGPDSFTFKAKDGALDSNIATVSILVRPVNDAPIANSGTAQTNEDNPMLIMLSASDIDSTGLTFALVTGPSNGSLSAIGAPFCTAVPNNTGTPGTNCTATVTYNPGANFGGSDSFTFRVNDGALDSNFATVNITVNASNDPAVGANDFYSTDLNTPLTLGAPGVLANDNDLDNPASSLTAVLVAGPTNAASFTFNADGSFTYTPNTGFTGTDSFTYKTNDGIADSNPSTVTVAVLAANNAPVAINDFYNIEKDTALNVPGRGVLANDNDLDTPAISLTATVVSAPTRALSFTLNPEGSFDYTPQANFTGNDSFTYKVNDGTSDSNLAMVTIAVIAPNTFPVANNDSEAVNEDSAKSVPAPGVLGNDSVAPMSASTAVLVSAPRRALFFTLNADGSFNYTPQNEYNGSDNFTYRVFDGIKQSNVAMVNLSVVAVNDLPIAQGQSVNTNQNTPVIITLSASDNDNKLLTFNIATPPAKGILGPIGTPNCTIQGQGATCTATVSYSPGSNYAGPDSFTFTSSDGVGTSAPAMVSINVILVNQPPTANAGGPYSGDVGIPVQFNGTGSDPDGNPIMFSWTYGDGGTGSGPNPTHTYSAPGIYPVVLTVTDSFNASAMSQTTVSINAGLVLNPIGNKTVNLGEVLSFTVSATMGTGSPISLFVAPLPLMTNATYNASTGVFTFRPSTTQVGTYQLTFSAQSGAQSVSETITINVPNPPPGGTTSVRGKVVNLQNVPLSNVSATLKSSGHVGITDANGIFTINGVPSGTQQLIVNGRQANLGVFAIIAVAVELINGVMNDLNSPISLPDVDVEAEIQVSPFFETVVSNPNLPGVTLEIAGGTAFNPDGTPFTGKLSINPVPDYGRPESRPEELRPGMAVTIQPAGIRFNPPARITFPNADGVPPGNEFNLWSLSPDTGKFNIVGKSAVSADGMSVITVEGGVTASAWHFPLSTATTSNSSQGSNFCGSCRTSVGSEANLEEGSLYISHTLPSYRSLGQSRSLSLTYSSITADPRPIISLDSTLSVRAAVPNSFSTRLKVGGVQQGPEIYTNSSSLPEDADSTSRMSVQFDASNLATGRYPFEATVFSNYLNSSVGGISTGNVIVFNRKTSAIGAGWAISDLQQLHIQSNGGVLLTSGDGTALFFTGGPDTFSSPARDFSTLVRNPADGMYTRTLKDGTKINFNSQGLQTSVVDRNLNTTVFTHDGSGRLTTVTDSVGLVTTLSYNGARLQSITDPAGRQTFFQHDSAGNLLRITNPDLTFLAYAYDAKGHITQATDERGLSTTYAYDFGGRFAQSTRPTGETRALVATKIRGLVDTAAGQGTPTNPAPIVTSANATASLTDGRGNQSRFVLDALGQVTSQIDALGQITTTVRDANGLPLRITRPNGAVVRMTYDAKGNLLTTADPVGATTTFTYEPVFNQVKTIRDPMGNTTTFNYDAKGNPIEIIDALNNRTQMIYDSRGLLISVSSAVGTAVQTTTSFTYDARGNLLTTTNPKGDVTTLTYNSAGSVSASTDAENRVTQFSYDLRNRLIGVLDADLKATQYGYDPKGNLTQLRDAKNQITTFTYDGLDRLVSATNPLGLTESFTYDSNGNLTSTTNRNSQTITFNYDALNRLTSKIRPPTSTESGNQSTAFVYDAVGNLLSISNPTASVINQYDAANRLVSSSSNSESVLSSSVVQINSDTTISASNFQFDGKSLQVNGRTVTVDGAHTFANIFLFNGAVLRHSPTTGSTAGKLDITITGTLQIDLTSRIDVTGLGFLAAGRAGNPFPSNGMTVGFQQGSGPLSGGSYGGVGGSGSNSSANVVYGDFRNPNEQGSGGGAAGSPGGNGGGLIRIVAQSLVLSGSIRANAGAIDPGGSTSGGSGGGIRIDVGTISGTGTINANGTPGAGTVGGGGSAGRIAIYYQNATGFNFGNVTAFGSTGPNTTNAGAGTIYLQGPARESGELIVDNNNVSTPSLSTPILGASSTTLTLTHFRVRRGARAKLDSAMSATGTLEVSANAEFAARNQITTNSASLSSNAILTHLATTGTTAFKLDLNVQNVTIDPTSRIDVTGLGFLAAGRAGNPFPSNGITVGFQQGSGPLSGGSYGGIGGSGGNTISNAVYGGFKNPNEQGSGGGTVGVPGGNGGGLIRIVAQSLAVNGSIRANGGLVDVGGSASGGSGGGIRIDVGTISGTGTINANGASGGGTTGGGGSGGRIAIYYQDATGFNFSNVGAFGSTGPNATNAGAGTVYLQGPARERGELIVDNNNVSTPSVSTPIAPVSGNLSLTHFRVRRQGHVKVNNVLDLTGTLELNNGAEWISNSRAIADRIDLSNNSVIVQQPTTGTTAFKVDLNANFITIDASSTVSAIGKGFLGGGQLANPFSDGSGMSLGFVKGSTGSSGGSHGGVGGSANGTANPVYDSAQDPQSPGSGGATIFRLGGTGGGVIRIAAGTLTLDGGIRAGGDAGVGDSFAAGGSGGAIRIDAGTLTGTGQIAARGGNGLASSGAGGGGRIAIYYGTVSGFNFATQVFATGGTVNGAPNGQDGTIYFQQQIAKLDPSFGDAVPVITAQGRMPRQRRTVSHGVPAAEHPNPFGSPVIGSAEAPAAIADSELQQRKIFGSTASVDTERATPLEQGNLYEALVIAGKLNPIATTVMLSQGSGASTASPRGASDSGSLPVACCLLPSSVLTPQASHLKPSEGHTAEDLDPIYTYDLNGNRTSMIDPTGLTTYAYDALNRMTSITNNKGQFTTFTYDALGRRTSMTHANGVVTTYDYDAASQLTRLAHQLGAASINAFDYVYDRVGNRTSKTSRDGAHIYTYDTLYRLTQAVNPLPTNPLETFNYDPVGNRINSNQNGSSIFNTANQLLEDTNFTYQYDNNGNQTRKTAKVGGAVTQYEYDAENKLVRVVSPSNTAIYKYDGLGRRVEKEVIAGTTTVAKYVYDNEDILLELNGTNQLVARYTHGPSIDEPLIMEKNGQSFYYHADGLGSITELTSETGSLVQRYIYSSFGKLESQLDLNVVQPYTFTSREIDAETGLYYYRARNYDPSVGRFLSADPIEFDAGPNFYAYVANNPIRWSDPHGLFITPDTILDIGFIVYDLYKLFADGRCSIGENLSSLGLDVVGAIVPGLTGLGAASKGARKADDIYVIGRQWDTAVSKNWHGHQILDITDWTLAKNDQWIQAIIDKNSPVYLASSSADNVWDVVNNRQTIFGREVEQLFSAGYTKVGDYLVPPKR